MRKKLNFTDPNKRYFGVDARPSNSSIPEDDSMAWEEDVVIDGEVVSYQPDLDVLMDGDIDWSDDSPESWDTNGGGTENNPYPDKEPPNPQLYNECDELIQAVSDEFSPYSVTTGFLSTFLEAVENNCLEASEVTNILSAHLEHFQSAPYIPEEQVDAFIFAYYPLYEAISQNYSSNVAAGVGQVMSAITIAGTQGQASGGDSEWASLSCDELNETLNVDTFQSAPLNFVGSLAYFIFNGCSNTSQFQSTAISAINQLTDFVVTNDTWDESNDMFELVGEFAEIISETANSNSQIINNALGEFIYAIVNSYSDEFDIDVEHINELYVMLDWFPPLSEGGDTGLECPPCEECEQLPCDCPHLPERIEVHGDITTPRGKYRLKGMVNTKTGRGDFKSQLGEQISAPKRRRG